MVCLATKTFLVADSGHQNVNTGESKTITLDASFRFFIEIVDPGEDFSIILSHPTVSEDKSLITRF